MLYRMGGVDSKSRLAALVLLGVLLGGCGNSPQGAMGHASGVQTDDKLTAQQQIDRVQNSPVMPQAAKDTTIQKIRDKYGIR